MPEIRELSDGSFKLHIPGDHKVRVEWKSYSKFVAEGHNLFVATP